RAPLLIAFDQFEEFFIRFREAPEVRSRFIEAIGKLIANTSIDCRLLFSLRSDFFSHIDELRPTFPDILSNSYRLGPLSALGARQAITRPLVHYKIAHDPRLVPDLVDQLARFDFDPTILQIAWGQLVSAATDRDPRKLRIIRADLDALGGIEGMLQRFLDN